MFLTNVLLKKVKTKVVLVEMVSLVSGFRFPHAKLRGSDKVECITYDPLIKAESVFVEKRRIKGIKLGK